MSRFGQSLNSIGGRDTHVRPGLAVNLCDVVDLEERFHRAKAFATDSWRPPSWRSDLLGWAPDIWRELGDRPLRLAGIWLEVGSPTGFNESLEMAHLLANSPGNSDLRDELAARLLTGLPSKRISLQMGLPLGVVRWFKAMSYDVRGRLKNRLFIHRAVLGTHQWSRSELPADWLLKAMAFIAGPSRLDELWAVHQTLRRDRLITVDDYLAPDAMTSIQLRGWIRHVLAEAAAVNPPAPELLSGVADGRRTIDLPPGDVTRKS